MNSGQIIESNGGGAGERDADAERVLEQEDKTLGLLPHKELVDFFLGFFNGFDFVEFCRIHYFKFLNSILTKKFKMKSTFL
jgi:hypothetical protein